MSEPVFALVLFALAFVPRLLVALRFDAEPVWDGHYYDFGARRIAAGFGYSDDVPVDGVATWHPWCHYPVGYSGFLGAFYRLFGATTHTAAVVNAVVGALLAVATFLLAAGIMGTWRARLAGLLVALHPGLVLYSALVMSEPLAALLTLVAFVCASRSREPVRGAAAAAILLGISALVRPQALLCAPFLAWRLLPGNISTFLHGKRLGHHGVRVAARAFAVLAVLACLVLAPVLPWTARNCKVMDGCALVSTNAGWNLAIGAFPRATGRFETLRSSDGCREVTGQVQQDRCWLHYGLDQIRQHPGHWLGLIPAKLGFTFDHESFPVQYLHEASPQLWPEERRETTRQLLTLFHRVLLAVATFAAVGLRDARHRWARRSRRGWWRWWRWRSSPGGSPRARRCSGRSRCSSRSSPGCRSRSAAAARGDGDGAVAARDDRARPRRLLRRGPLPPGGHSGALPVCFRPLAPARARRGPARGRIVSLTRLIRDTTAGSCRLDPSSVQHFSSV